MQNYRDVSQIYGKHTFPRNELVKTFVVLNKITRARFLLNFHKILKRKL